MNVVELKESPAALEAKLWSMLEKQRKAYRDLGSPNAAKRRDNLERLGRALRRYQNEICEAVSADFGNRSKHETLMAEVFIVISSIKHARKHLAGWMKHKNRAVDITFFPGRAKVIYQPLGVVGIIAPWNYPVQLALNPLVCALAAGNRVMLKPSEFTPRTSDVLARMLGEIFEESEVAVVLGGMETAAAFAGLPFDHLLFTGATSTGTKIMAAAARNLTPVTLELGGKSPAFIAENYDIEKAAANIAAGKLLNAGQTCISPDYVLCPADKVEDFVAAFGKAVTSFYPSLRDNGDYTSIINDRHYDRLQDYLTDAAAKGAKVRPINPRNEDLPKALRKIAPTVVTDVSDDMRICNDEIFGPLLPIIAYKETERAIEYINGHPRPLALYVFSEDKSEVNRLLYRTVSGGVTVNDTLLHLAQENLPFGGVGPSGMGSYHGEAGFLTMSHSKSVFVQSRFGTTKYLRPPYGWFFNNVMKVLIGKNR